MDIINVRGEVEWDGRRVMLEGPQDFVSAELAKFRDAALGKRSAPSSRQASGEEAHRPLNDAAFLKSKGPRDHFEKIAVLAVRLRDQGTTEFDGEEMRRAYLRAGVKPPKVIAQALVDTKRKRDFIEPSSSRGKYRLTSHGADFVQFDLPRSEAQ